jgi:hypothetical protein
MLYERCLSADGYDTRPTNLILVRRGIATTYDVRGAWSRRRGLSRFNTASAPTRCNGSVSRVLRLKVVRNKITGCHVSRLRVERRTPRVNMVG